MATSTSAYRLGIEAYANEEISAIYNVSSQERGQSINELQIACLTKDHGLPWTEVKSLFQTPVTERELCMRAAFQTKFEELSEQDLQSHFTYFYQKGQVITRLVAEAGTSNDMRGRFDSQKKANSVIVDELGKTLLRRGIQPQVPSDIRQKKV